MTHEELVIAEDREREAAIEADAFPLPKCCRVCKCYDHQSAIVRYDGYDNATGESYSYAHRSCHETGHRELVICERCHQPKAVCDEYTFEDCRPAKEYQWVNGCQIPGPSHGAHVYVTVTVAGNSPALDAMTSTVRTV